jgi:hypothetical protein
LKAIQEGWRDVHARDSRMLAGEKRLRACASHCNYLYASDFMLVVINDIIPFLSVIANKICKTMHLANATDCMRACRRKPDSRFLTFECLVKSGIEGINA